jgi:hypothetical protein
MMPVPSNLHYHGFDYTQVSRDNRSCLYRQTLMGEPVGLEVFLISIQPGVTLNGVTYQERERWPRDEDFGKTAWSYWTIEEAMERFNLLEN